ncbi:MAG: hypothetical protein HZB30_09870 [Nitrospirae bacterium]|nr:hypothetical protein [Nitrospirota bacterium]
MFVSENKKEKETNDIWIISEGRFVNLDLSNICEQPVSKPVTEYRISELAGYLLNPNPVTVEEKVIGCRVKHSKSPSGIAGRILKKLFPDKKRSSNGAPFVEEFISTSKIGTPAFQDEDLNKHFIKINELLRPFDPVLKKLAGLNGEKIDDITAMCEDIGSNRYQLNLQGNVNEKLNYIMNSISKKVNIVFNKAYLSKGLFEMRGFNFHSFNAHIFYRLIRFTQDNQTKYCVLKENYQLKYWVHDSELVHFMHILEQSIKTDPKLKEALALCVEGGAKPLKLFFSKKLEKSYTEKYLPLTYRKVFDMYEMNQVAKASIASMLNDHQSIVSFNYIPKTEAEKQKLFINISVLHDIKALEPIKSKLPLLYSEINKKAPPSDIGKLYLLDSMSGYQNV